MGGDALPTSKQMTSECGEENRAFLNSEPDDPNPEKCIDQGKKVTKYVVSLEEEDQKAAATLGATSSSKDESGARVRESKDDVRSSSGGGDPGHDADEEGWETASEGRDEFEEATGGEEESEPAGTGENENEVNDGEPNQPEASTSDQAEELQNKLSELSIEEVRKQAVEAANTAKTEGNALYGEKKFVEALQAYDRGLGASELKESDVDPAIEIKEIRAILHCNRAACYIGLDNNDAAVRECTKALELNPQYVKALVRRAQTREKLTLYEEAMADWQKVLEIDPGMSLAKTSLRQLGPLAEEKREKLKAEMISKLKEAGNSILGRFGMSIDNFKTVQDPSTGSYSVQFQR